MSEPPSMPPTEASKLHSPSATVLRALFDELETAYYQQSARIAALEAQLAEAEKREAGLPEDLFTHQHSWRVALMHCRDTACTHDDRNYWQHELIAFDRTWEALAALSQPPAPADGSEKR